MSLFRRRRSGPSLTTSRTARRSPARRLRGWEPLESRRLLARDFLEAPNDVFPGQAVEHFAPSETGVVHSVSQGASITAGDVDYYTFTASVTGEIVVRFTNNGGNPDGDATTDVGLTLTRRDVANALVGSPVNLASSGASGAMTFSVTAGTSYYVRVEGATIGNDANYTLSIENRDINDDLGGNNDRLSTATPLGAYTGSPLTANDMTITSPDRDFYLVTIPAGQSGQPFNATITMPAGSGASSGPNGPTNLGIRVRNAAGTIVATSNTTTSAVDTARFDVPASGSPQTYYLEVYSGSLGQVNVYDLQLSAIPQVGAISGFKWNDVNGDGLRQESEPGIPGWQIFIDQNSNLTYDVGEPVAVTDASGFYSFPSLPYGTHTVAETIPLNYVQTWPGVETNYSYTFTLNRDDFALDHLDFGNYLGATVSGTKFNDLDADGVAQEVGEPGLAGWTFFVDYNNDGALNVGEPSAISNVAGDYTINGVLAGTYRVREVATVNWTNSFPSTVDGFSRYYEFTFTSGAAFVDADFGNWTTGSVSGVKFEDLDADGLNQEGGEPGVAGFTVYVDYDNDSSLDVGEPSATTGVGGAYTITGVLPGTWNVREVAQVGWTQSYPAPLFNAAVVQSQQNATGVNFGNWRPATITGTKYNDLNANGVIDGGEPGLAGWTFYVDYNNNSALDPGEPSASSGAGGAYSITGVTPGTWTVREVGQPGWTNSFPALGSYTQLFTSNSTTNNRNFANWTTGTVSGTKYNDVDGDGTVPEAGELGLSGWRFYVDYDNDSVWDNPAEPSALSDGSGAYTIVGVNPGNWNLREVGQAGWVQTAPAGGAPHAITVQSNGALTGRNFGNFQLAGISGQKFNDVDGDGAKDPGELGLAGWTIFIDADNSGTLNGVEVSTVTDGAGNYSFPGLNPGSYRIREVQQLGWTQTTANPAPINLASGQAVPNIDFGNFQLTTISGQKFNDLDGDGVKDPGELGIPGWQIYIDADNSGTLNGLETPIATNANGDYAFTNLGPGSYVIREVPQVGWTQTTTNPAAIALQSGTPVANVDFGNFQTVTISGYKYEDLNGNGTSNGGTDPGVGGFTIELIRDANNNGLVDDPVFNSQLTPGSGLYSFSNLGPGRYFVREQTPLPVGWTQSAPVGNLYTIVVASGSNVPNQDFGNWRPGTISGVKFRDLDGDGTYPTEVGDAPLGGFTIYVDYNNDGVQNPGEPFAVSAAVTGVYTINGVAPGTWKVREVVSPGYSNTYPATNDAFGRFHSVTVASNSTNSGYDFLNYEVISISGQKFADLGTTGVKDPTDPGLAGWKIELFSDVNNNNLFQPNQYVGEVLVNSGADGDPVYTTFTDSNGDYELGAYGGFVVGQRYFVREVQQNGFQQTFGGTYSFVYNNASVTNLDFGNQSCNGDTWNVVDGTTTFVAPRVGILTVQLEGPGALSVSKTLGGTFRYYTGLSAGVGTSAVGSTAAGIANPYAVGVRADLIVDAANTSYDITIVGAGPNTKLRIINSVNVDVQSTLGLQITTGACGDFVGVYDDPDFGVTSDAKRIFVGAVLGNINSGAPLTFEGAQYDAQYINALYNSNPSISKIDILTNGGDDIVRVGDSVTQQMIVNLGDGNDLLRAGGGKSTAYGGNGNDGIVGGDADDVFYGQNGFDVIAGQGGNDRITGDADADILSGGLGNETWLKGGAGNDRISGGAGADAIYGEAGTDTVYRDAADVIISTAEIILSVPPNGDAVEALTNQLIDNVFNDAFVADADDDGALDTIDELINSLL